MLQSCLIAFRRRLPVAFIQTYKSVLASCMKPIRAGNFCAFIIWVNSNFFNGSVA